MPVVVIVVLTLVWPPLCVPSGAPWMVPVNVREPVGVPPPVPVTVAVNVTDWLTALGLGDDVNVIVGVAWFTT